MGKRRKAYTLTKKELKEYGFTECYFDESLDKWIVKRFWKTGMSPVKVEKDIKVSFTNDYHPYGDDQSAPVITFSVNSKPISISFPRFAWAWYYGRISYRNKIKTNNSKNIKDWELVDIRDHSYYKKANATTIIKEMIEGKRPFKF